jgi:type I restriction enzyme S subunit
MSYSQWEDTKIEQLIDIKHGFAFKGEFFSEENNSFYVLTPGNFAIGGGFIEGKPKYYKGDFPKSYILQPGEIVITMTDLSKEGDTLGYPAIIPHDKNSYLHNQRIGRVVFLSEKIDRLYLFYRLRNRDYQKYIVGMATGSTVKHTSPNSIKSFSLKLPAINTQKNIANILSSLDDKIELNNKINKNLEAMAQTLYKRWFVDFEFPNENGEPYKSSGGEMVESELGLIPKGWEVKTQGSYFPVLTGKKNANISSIDGNYMFFTCSQVPSKTREYSFDASAILVAGNGDFNVKYYKGKFEAYQRTYVLIPYKKNLAGLLFFSIKKNLESITRGHRGSVIKFITKGQIEDFKVVFPRNSLLDRLSEKFEGLINLIENYKIENESLAKIRDLLLPKLMSGAIEVPVKG